MPVFVAALWGAALNIAGTLAGRVMIGLGISVVTYTGLSSSINFLQSNAVAQLSGLPATILSILSIMKVGQAMSVIASATAMKLTLDGLTSDTFRKWVK